MMTRWLCEWKSCVVARGLSMGWATKFVLKHRQEIFSSLPLDLLGANFQACWPSKPLFWEIAVCQNQICSSGRGLHELERNLLVCGAACSCLPRVKCSTQTSACQAHCSTFSNNSSCRLLHWMVIAWCWFIRFWQHCRHIVFSGGIVLHKVPFLGLLVKGLEGPAQYVVHMCSGCSVVQHLSRLCKPDYKYRTAPPPASFDLYLLGAIKTTCPRI